MPLSLLPCILVLSCFFNVYLYDDITEGLTDWATYLLPAIALFIGSPLAQGSPSDDTVGNTVLVYVACFLLIVPLSCSNLERQKQRHQQEQQIQNDKDKARQQAILDSFNKDN